MGKVLAIGMKASTLYLAKGRLSLQCGQKTSLRHYLAKVCLKMTVQPYLKGLYQQAKAESSPEIRQQMDKGMMYMTLILLYSMKAAKHRIRKMTPPPSQTSGTMLESEIKRLNPAKYNELVSQDLLRQH